MADPKSKTKKVSKKPETRTMTKEVKKGGIFSKYKFHWWHAAILILLVVITGIVIIRFSRASGGRVLPPTGRVVNSSDIAKSNTITSFMEYKGDCNVYSGAARTQCFDNQNKIKTIKEIYDSELVKLNCDNDFCTGQSTVNLFISGDYCVIPTYSDDASAVYMQFSCSQAGIAQPLPTPVGAPPVTPPGNNQTFGTYQQQLVNSALLQGADPNVLKNFFCHYYTNVTDCQTYVDQAVQAITRGTPPTPPPPCNVSTGCDDGHWQQLTENTTFYYNPNYQGGAQCVTKDGVNPNHYSINNPIPCDQLKLQAKCKQYLDAILRGDYSLIPTMPKECGGDEMRAALDFANAVKLNQSAPIGNLDGINGDCSTMYGWTASDANPQQALTVDLYLDGPAGQGKGIAHAIPANEYRGDVGNAFGGKYGPFHGFSYNIPNELKDLKNHTIFAYGIGKRTNGTPNGVNTLLGQKSFTCDYPPRGNVDSVEAKVSNKNLSCTINGWAQDQSDPNAQINVDIYFDGPAGRAQGAAKGTANNYRGDLQSAGIGNGDHAYTVEIPDQFKTPGDHTAYVYGIGVDQQGRQNGVNALIGTKGFNCNVPPAGSLDAVVVTSQNNNLTCKATGWTADKSAILFNNGVTLYFDLSPDAKTYSQLVNTYPAKNPRPDVNAAGYAGNHGFEFPIPAKFFDGQRHTINAYGMNIDKNGTQVGNFNTFIGKKEFTCPNKNSGAITNPGLTDQTDQTQNTTESYVTKAQDTNNNKQITVVVTQTPASYNAGQAALQLSAATKDSQTIKGNKVIPTTLPGDLQLANTQATGDNGPVLQGSVLIKPSLPQDIGINKVVIYIDGKNAKVYNSLDEAQRELDTTKLSNGVHTIQTLAYAGNNNVRALQQRINVQNNVNWVQGAVTNVQNVFSGI